MATFFWLSVISLDLWNGMKGVFVLENRFLAYNCYAWGMSVVLTGITYLSDKLVDNEDWNPRMGAKGFCWINSEFQLYSNLKKLTKRFIFQLKIGLLCSTSTDRW